ncbi:MAG TPA: hypothetical protein VMG80_05585, partial [Solirubrobacteraceae bacterium]|nr:hypothetical protein [Solirubrobacteraceae bacterium]
MAERTKPEWSGRSPAGPDGAERTGRRRADRTAPSRPDGAEQTGRRRADRTAPSRPGGAEQTG